MKKLFLLAAFTGIVGAASASSFIALSKTAITNVCGDNKKGDDKKKKDEKACCKKDASGKTCCKGKTAATATPVKPATK